MKLTKKEQKIRNKIDRLYEEISSLESDIGELQERCNHKFKTSDWGYKECVVCDKVKFLDEEDE